MQAVIRLDIDRREVSWRYLCAKFVHAKRRVHRKSRDFTDLVQASQRQHAAGSPADTAKLLCPKHGHIPSRVQLAYRELWSSE